MGTPCNPSLEDGMEYAAEITTRPKPDGRWYFRCGCGTEAAVEGGQEDATQALADHRALDPGVSTPAVGEQ